MLVRCLAATICPSHDIRFIKGFPHLLLTVIAHDGSLAATALIADLLSNNY